MKIASEDDAIGRMVMMSGRGWVIQNVAWDGFTGDHILTLERVDHSAARRDAIRSGKPAPRLRVVFAAAADCRE